MHSGIISSALDEFISRRIPIQLGGMSDPFSLIEKKKEITYKYLQILSEYNYPVIVSTKSDLISTPKYLDIVKKSNIYVRFSTTVISEDQRAKIDKGCPEYNKILTSADKLSRIDIPVSLRFQPIIPFHEKHAIFMLNEAMKVGVKHISAEYLKVPIDANKKFGASLVKLLNGDPIKTYRELGANKLGREYILPLSYRSGHLISMGKEAKRMGMTFGFGDNDLLIHSCGSSCCNASDLYLNESSTFDANIVSLAKSKSVGDKIFISEYLNTWLPKKKISTYLNSKSRIEVNGNDTPQWIHYLEKMWTGEHGVFAPSFFNGIEKTDEKDELGMPIYKRVFTKFESDYYL
ncbi:hypothetical protein [Pseudoalteromonas sp. SG45-2]|uniref:hypothetical protein n=1 Tax=Pseudoalteromonas sp. SG45-2 TaxID=2760956 RepID=UPI0016006E57|nr:hypothetical protein [Pseudoalteromonas sp. SG45-2]MBB1346024.1 hypothetical protein [Pseudoalteromonas sp. SG45-2]